MCSVNYTFKWNHVSMIAVLQHCHPVSFKMSSVFFIIQRCRGSISSLVLRSVHISGDNAILALWSYYSSMSVEQDCLQPCNFQGWWTGQIWNIVSQLGHKHPFNGYFHRCGLCGWNSKQSQICGEPEAQPAGHVSDRRGKATGPVCPVSTVESDNN